LLWNDDKQIDELIIRRRRDHNASGSTTVTVELKRIEGQHGGVPSYFRARCFEASKRLNGDYSTVGYHWAVHLESECPYDSEDGDWEHKVTKLLHFLETEQDENVWVWFREHFPKHAQHVRTRHKSQFLLGVKRAFEDERMDF